MDEPNATRVTTPPAEAAGRGEQLRPPKTYAFAVRVTSPFSAKHLTGLILEVLQARGNTVESIRATFDTGVLCTYDRQKDGR